MGVFTLLTPILPVADVAAEREFYEGLGFTQHVDPDERYPETVFVALESGPSILFGLAFAGELDASLPSKLLMWQFETTDLDAVYARATKAGARLERPPELEEWGRRTMKLRSPSGYLVTFEERR